MKSKQSALQSKVPSLALLPFTLEGPGCPGRWRPDRWRPRATREDTAGAEAPSAHGQTRKGTTFGFTCLALDRTERAQKKRKSYCKSQSWLAFRKNGPRKRAISQEGPALRTGESFSGRARRKGWPRREPVLQPPWSPTCVGRDPALPGRDLLFCFPFVTLSRRPSQEARCTQSRWILSWTKTGTG